MTDATQDSPVIHIVFKKNFSPYGEYMAAFDNVEAAEAWVPDVDAVDYYIVNAHLRS